MGKYHKLNNSSGPYRKDKSNNDSITLLKKSGINFDKLASEGIGHEAFCEYFMTSGLIMNNDVHWYGFHTDHDFAYLLKLLSSQPIPATEKQFMADLSLIFPNIYDVKSIADMSMGIFRGGLSSLSDKLQVFREDDC